MKGRRIVSCLFAVLFSLLTMLPLALIAQAAMTGGVALAAVHSHLSPNAQPKENFTPYSIPTGQSNPWGITQGPDGNLWFTESAVGKIGKITLAGKITEYSIPSPGSGPLGITAGPDGNLWFTEFPVSKIGMITPGGSFTEYATPTQASSPLDITTGPDGNLWFTEAGANQIGKITPGGSFTEYPISTPNSAPYGIVAGADGNLWFTEQGGNNIGRITTGGKITSYSIPTANSLPTSITAEPGGLDGNDPGGNLWFTEQNGNKIGRITLKGKISEFTVPTTGSGPSDITAGPDGILWFTEFYGNKIGRITPGGTLSEYLIPDPNSMPNEITTGPDGNLWFADQGGNDIWQLNINMSYHNGPIMPGTMNVYVIFWEPTGSVATNYHKLIEQYYTDLSGVNGQKFYNILPQYKGTNGAPANAILADTWTDPDPYPQGCGTPCILTTAQILAEVKAAQAANGWKAGPSNYFPVYTSDTAGTSVKKACAYHNYDPGSGIIFAHNVYPGVVPGCTVPKSPNNCVPCDSAISISAHEQFEAATDPTFSNSKFTGWYTLDQTGEIGDLCAFDYGKQKQDGSNQNWNGHPYIIQMMWDNSKNSCQQSGP